ncbi:MAG: NUDIX hydrolase [Actinomycetota bacterium]
MATELPISIKAVVSIGGAVLLARNARAEWELLGGQPESSESPRETVRREVAEEAGIDVVISESPLDAYVFDVIPSEGHQVFIVTYDADDLPAGTTYRASAEHQALELFSVEEALGLDDLPPGYKASIRLARLAR